MSIRDHKPHIRNRTINLNNLNKIVNLYVIIVFITFYT